MILIFIFTEILDFCDFLSPTAEEQVSRTTAVQSVTNVITYIWPNCKVYFFLLRYDIDRKGEDLIVYYCFTGRSFWFVQDRFVPAKQRC